MTVFVTYDEDENSINIAMGWKMKFESLFMFFDWTHHQRGKNLIIFLKQINLNYLNLFALKFNLLGNYTIKKIAQKNIKYFIKMWSLKKL